MKENRVFNFNPGPAAIPLEVLEEIQEEFLNFKGSGMSITEISHRSKPFDDVINDAIERKENLIKSLTDTKEKEDEFARMKSTYQNQAVMQAVRNENSASRIVMVDQQLIQRIYPVFSDDHRPKHKFDIKANFFQGTKHFLGFKIDTFYFNIAFIWLMSLLLYISLYYDLLKRFINLFDRGLPKTKRV